MLPRRDFCKRLGTSALAVCAANSLSPTATAIDPFVRPTPGQMKLSLSAYSLRKYLAPKGEQAKRMDLFEFVDYCFEQGLTGAELTSYYFPEDFDQDYLRRLKTHCHLRGISVSGGAIRNDFCQADAAAVEKDLAHTRRWIDAYAYLGAPAIRIFAGKQSKEEPLEETLQRCADNCETACEYAAEKGMLLALENHGGVTAKALDLLSIVKAVDSPAFGVNFDSGNFRATNAPYQELQLIAPFAINAQVKVEITIDGKRQPADLPKIMAILKNAGYSGWVALEYEGSEEPLEAIPRYLQQLKQYIA